MKKRKKIKIDGLPMKSWKYRGKEMARWLWKFFNRVGKGEA